jgi:hypothetical protein
MAMLCLLANTWQAEFFYELFISASGLVVPK